MFADVLLDTIIDSLRLLPFLYITYILISLLELGVWSEGYRALKKAGFFTPLLGALLGVIPQCGLSAAAGSLYAGRIVTLGTMLGVFLSCSDEMLPILIAQSAAPVMIIKILAAKAIIAAISGLAVDAVIKLVHSRRRNNINSGINTEFVYRGKAGYGTARASGAGGAGAKTAASAVIRPASTKTAGDAGAKTAASAVIRPASTKTAGSAAAKTAASAVIRPASDRTLGEATAKTAAGAVIRPASAKNLAAPSEKAENVRAGSGQAKDADASRARVSSVVARPAAAGGSISSGTASFGSMGGSSPVFSVDFNYNDGETTDTSLQDALNLCPCCKPMSIRKSDEGFASGLDVSAADSRGGAAQRSQRFVPGVLTTALRRTLSVFIYIFIISFVLNAIMEAGGETFIKALFSSVPVVGELIAALIGLIPNCASSVALTELYLADAINEGAVIAGLLTNSGVGLLVLLRQNKNAKENALIIALIIALGVIWGVIIQAVGITF